MSVESVLFCSSVKSGAKSTLFTENPSRNKKGKVWKRKCKLQLKTQLFTDSKPTYLALASAPPRDRISLSWTPHQLMETETNKQLCERERGAFPCRCCRYRPWRQQESCKKRSPHTGRHQMSPPGVTSILGLAAHNHTHAPPPHSDPPQVPHLEPPCSLPPRGPSRSLRVRVE